MLKGCIFSMLAAVAFGMSAIFVKLCYATGMRDMDVLQFRWTAGAVLLLLLLLLRNPHLLKAGWKTIGKAFVLGVVFHGLGGVCWVKSLKYIPASTAALILYFYPVVVTLLSRLVFQMKTGRVVLLSLALITVGCGFVFYDAFLKALSMEGLVLAVATMAVFSLCMIFNQIFIRGERYMTLTFYMVFLTGVLFSALSNPLRMAEMSGYQLFLGLCMGLIPTAAAYLLHFRAIEAVGSAYTSIFSTFEPITTVVMACLLLGENIVVWQVLGIPFIIGGIVLPNVQELRKNRRWREARRE